MTSEQTPQRRELQARHRELAVDRDGAALDDHGVRALLAATTAMLDREDADERVAVAARRRATALLLAGAAALLLVGSAAVVLLGPAGGGASRVVGLVLVAAVAVALALLATAAGARWSGPARRTAGALAVAGGAVSLAVAAGLPWWLVPVALLALAGAAVVLYRDHDGGRGGTKEDRRG